MKEHYVSYAKAEALKRLGFNEECRHYYVKFKDDGEIKFWWQNPQSNHNERQSRNEVCSAPTLHQVHTWLREVKGIALNIIAHDGGKYHWSEVYLPTFKEKGYEWYKYREHPLMDSYELALSAGIDAVLELLEKGECNEKMH